MFLETAVNPVNLQLDALKLLKDWSSWLVSIQAAVLALLALWGKDKVQLPPVIAHWVFVFFGGSIIFATFVLGGIPSIMQRVQGGMNIYSIPLFEWLPERLGTLRTLWFFSFMEHILFLIGMIIFMLPFLPGMSSLLKVPLVSRFVSRFGG
ncbi:MAG TPA: hypothetical protein VER76_20770 [Pyrinomonadaceae bacterium]|nr:hypothetical protein [Pyrinomonadaceae bacterium]